MRTLSEGDETIFWGSGRDEDAQKFWKVGVLCKATWKILSKSGLCWPGKDGA
jgi:hypothetical protein